MPTEVDQGGTGAPYGAGVGAGEGLLEHAGGRVDGVDLDIVEGSGGVDVQDADDAAVHRQGHRQLRHDSGHRGAIALPVRTLRDNQNVLATGTSLRDHGGYVCKPTFCVIRK